MSSSMGPRSIRVLLLALLLLAGVVPVAQAQGDIVELENAYPNVSFDFPLGIRFPDDGLNKVYIAEHGGRVKVMDNVPSADEATVFLDLSERLATSPPGELYGIEFHPNYAENGYFFVRYKLEEPHRTLLSRFKRSEGNPLEADPESEEVLFEVETPGNGGNHHGGDIAFGLDGYLYVPVGDGGTYQDQAGNAQDMTKLLGKVLRLDVDNPEGELDYGIPPDNPFVGNTEGWREEIFASGFRNPWRLTIDRATGDVWVGDVGEVDWEEVNYVESGHNYGWPIMEGRECAPFEPSECDQTGLTLPVWAYPHEVGLSITGGYVYRGSKIPVLQGKYVYLDFSTKKMWAIEREDPQAALLVLDHGFASTTFGQDMEGELYVSKFFEGTIWKLNPGPGASDLEGEPGAASPFNLSVFPHPVRNSANVYFESEAGQVRISVYDLLGREVAVLYDQPVGLGARRTVEFDTSRLVSGLYIVRLEAHGEVETKKMIVVR